MDEVPHIATTFESIASEIMREPLTTITDRKFESPSKDIHDYISKAPYWYEGSDGKPVLKDGQVNPESKKASDKETLINTHNNVLYVTLALHESEKNGNTQQMEVYRAYLENVFSAWFIDEETKMNPSLEYAQMKPGDSTGRIYGIIEGNYLTRFTGVAKMLRDKGLLSEEVSAGTEKWFSQYLDWLITSDKGKDESVRKNNHATFYTAQVVQIADYLGRDDLVKVAVEHTKSLIASQIEADGSMPEELKRKGVEYDYQLFNLYGFSIIAEIASKYDLDLWHYKSSKGVGLEEAFNHFVDNQLSHAGEQPFKFDRTGELFLTFRAAAGAYKGKHDTYFELPKRYYNNELADMLTANHAETWLYYPQRM